MNVLFVSSRPREGGTTMREGYQVYWTKETANVLIPCTLIVGLLMQGTNVNITIRAVPEPSLLSRRVSRSAISWCMVEEVDSPSCYQDMLAGRFESRPVGFPLEEELDPSYGPPEPLYKPESKPEPRGTNPNILLTIQPILAPVTEGRNPASCSLPQRERNVGVAFCWQTKVIRQL